MSVLKLKESFNLFRKNLILMVPDFVSILITYSLVALLFFYTGFSDLAPLVQSAETASLDLLKDFLSENLTKIILSSIIFLFTTFIVGVSVTTIKFDMITDLVHNKKPSLKSSFFKSKHFFWSVVLLRICIFIIFAFFFILTLLLGGLLYLLFSNWGSQIAIIISLAVMIPIALIIFIALKFILLFAYQYMFLNNQKTPIGILKYSITLFKTDASFVILSGLFVFALSFIVYGLSNIISKLISIIPFFSIYLTPVWSVIQIIISVSVSVIISIFLFLQLKSKKH